MRARRRFSTRRACRRRDPRVDAYGEVDELNACLGAARGVGREADLRRCARDDPAAALRRRRPAGRPVVADRGASDEGRCSGGGRRAFGAVDRRLRSGAARRCADSSFPVAAHAGAWLHLARTVCRRAERRVVGLGEGAVEPIVVVYLNRLSDLLFVMARAANHRQGVPEDRMVSDLDAAYASCEHDRPGALREFSGGVVAACRGRMRRHVAAVYAFARAADDFADEGMLPAARAPRAARRMAGAAASRGRARRSPDRRHGRANRRQRRRDLPRPRRHHPRQAAALAARSRTC